jgi:hypothetical protein
VNPVYPVYVVSKGRWESCLTSRNLHRMRVPHYVVVERAELERYRAALDPLANPLVLDQAYQRDYDTFDALGDTKSKGPGPARNFAWEHSISLGARWHWVMDDNIRDFYRLNRNVRIRVHTSAIFRAAEDFVDRYENLALAGLHYKCFAPDRSKRPAFLLNTRIYSCILIKNDIPYRWRGRYNEDTDLSLRALKDGWCTVLFFAFLADKTQTMTMKGGNTDAFYAREGTLPKSRMLVNMHPDVARLTWKWDRWHHHVDYRPFKKNQLIPKSGVVIPEGVDNFGMKLTEVA